MHSKPNKFRVGLVQMAMSGDPQANEEKAAAKVEEAARKGAEVVCLPELFRTPYFCQREDAALFDLAEPVPGPSGARFAKVAKQAGVAVIVPIFEKRAAGLYHNSASSSTPTASRSGSTARCTSPTTRPSTRSSTSRRATWGSRRST